MAAKAGKSPPMRHRFGLTLWRAARLVVLDPAGAKLVLFVVVAALAAIGVHVDPARPFHLAHMIDQILRVVSHIAAFRSEEHTSELQSLMRISYAVFCLKKKKKKRQTHIIELNTTTIIN